MEMSVDHMESISQLREAAYEARLFTALPRLNRMHMIAGSVHLMTSFIVSYILFFVVSEMQGRSPITLLLWTRSSSTELHTLIAQFPVMLLPAFFSMLASIHHMWVSTCGRPEYESAMRQKRQPARWMEYYFSAAVMNVEIALLLGITELSILVCVAVLTSTCMVFGNLGDLTADTEKNVDGRFFGFSSPLSEYCFWAGCPPFMLVWTYIFSVFIGNTIVQVVPGFVIVIVFGLFVLESLFALHQARHINFIQKENGFIWLSLFSKQALVWLTVGGILNLYS